MFKNTEECKGLKDTELQDFIGVIDQVGQLEDIWGGKRDVTLKDETGHIKSSIWKETAHKFPGKAGLVILIKNGQRRTVGAVALITTVEVTSMRVKKQSSKIFY